MDDKTEAQREAEEAAYERGSRMAHRLIMQQCISRLGYDVGDSDMRVARLLDERDEAIQALREVCEEFGDNDWPNDLSLADIIEKHLGRNLRQYND